MDILAMFRKKPKAEVTSVSTPQTTQVINPKIIQDWFRSNVAMLKPSDSKNKLVMMKDGGEFSCHFDNGPKVMKDSKLVREAVNKMMVKGCKNVLWFVQPYFKN